MNRSEFVRNSCKWIGAAATGVCLAKVTGRAADAPAETPSVPVADEALRKQLAQAEGTNQFVNNWLADLFDAIDSTLDKPAQTKLLEACGRGCFNRHEFKRAIARDGSGDLDKLIAAYKRNFEIWREGDFVHIRYGEKSPGCYCPAARNRPAKPNDIHCECTRTTHQTIFETALGRPFKVDVLQSIRRGGQTCHFRVHLQPVETAG
ncbi:hypothetical protein [Opitutus terrae]|uniref:Transcriptional regulator n=1 Tax=Opitutus terrae (strain DSM 11246 / JCM 15787 / PB90-1) TaxID=452637 RepID=B1ZV14_OPITP|nr:hypothetical protein [Opitutus terrae]ACB75984.1 hypothetical protein Oter_2703 [Opitutus terrae PB90-1]